LSEERLERMIESVNNRVSAMVSKLDQLEDRVARISQVLHRVENQVQDLETAEAYRRVHRL